MAVNLSPIWGAGAQLLDNSGNVLSGGKIYTYAAGTTTQVATYTSNSGLTANSNPIVLNSAGRVPYEIWLTDGQNYKFVLKDSNDVLIGTWDNLSGINSNFIAYTNEQEIQTATAGQTVFNLTTMQYLPGTGNLSVFVDGVNQYGPDAQYAYEETDQTTITFTQGLHVGALVKFTSTQIQNAGAVDASQVSYTPPFTNSVPTNVEDKLAQYVSVKDFGAVGDGVTDDTAAIQNALDATSGNTLYFPAGIYYTETGVTASANTTIIGYEATLQNTTNAIKLLTLATGCSVIGLSFVGNGSTYDDNGNGIYVTGTRNGVGVAPTYATDILVENCSFNNLSGYGIQLLFAKNTNVLNNKITNIGYSGVMVYSCENVEVIGNYIDTLTGETYSGTQNAYGVAFTANNSTTDRVRDPVSRYCRAANNYVKNIPTWHGMDTHGGWNIEFINNQIINCRRAIVLTHLGDVGSNYCTIQGNVAQNYLSGTNTSGSNKQSEAFWDIGPSSTTLNYGNRIVGNTTWQYGDPAATSGVIFIQNTEDGEVSGNFIQNGYVSGIIVAGYVYRYGIRNNSIVDVQSDGSRVTACVRFLNDVFQKIDISHNTFSRKNTSLNTSVSEVGVLVANTANKSIAFFKNAFNAVVQKFYIPETTGLSGEITSTYTGTLTGLTTSPTLTVQYEIVGTTATISIPSGTTGTSNSTALTITGAPECLLPSNTQYNLTRVTDNGTVSLGVVRVASGTATLVFNKNVTMDGFTSSGTKGIPEITFTYSLQ